MKKTLLLLFLSLPLTARPQTVLYDIVNTAVYDLLEELASEHIITVTS